MDEEVELTVERIRSLKIQGARSIAVAALKTLRHTASKSGFGEEFIDACGALEKSRPTAVPLHNAICIAKKSKSLDAINCLLRFIAVADKSVAATGAGIIKNNMTVLTHCHSSEAVALMKLAKAQGKKFRVIVTETRPMLQGIKTARELIAAKIPVDYVVDSAAGFYMTSIDLAIFGCDAIRKGGIYNKIGTYMMALACRENKIPVYFVGDSLKIDRRPAINIEMRPESEIISAKELKGARILNPAFDCMPWKLVTGIVTEEGVFSGAKKLFTSR